MPRNFNSHAWDMIGAGMAHWFAPPLPPNRTCGVPAYSSPVGALLLFRRREVLPVPDQDCRARVCQRMLPASRGSRHRLRSCRAATNPLHLVYPSPELRRFSSHALLSPRNSPSCRPSLHRHDPASLRAPELFPALVLPTACLLCDGGSDSPAAALRRLRA